MSRTDGDPESSAVRFNVRLKKGNLIKCDRGQNLESKVPRQCMKYAKIEIARQKLFFFKIKNTSVWKPLIAT